MKFAEETVGVIEVLRFMKDNPQRFDSVIKECLKMLASPD